MYPYHLGTSVAKSTAASATNVRIILFYKKKPAASPTAVPVMQGVAMPEATPAPTTVMPVATPVQATYA